MDNTFQTDRPTTSQGSADAASPRIGWCWVAPRSFAKTYGKVEDEAVRRSGKWDLILVKYGRPSIRAYQNRAMTFRNTAGACVFWCLVGLIVAQQPVRLPVRADDDDSLGEFMELGWNEHGSISPEELCRSLCGECQCRGQLVSENLCQCSCEFAPANGEGEQNCTAKVQRLCNQMDVQCDFNGPDDAGVVRSPRGCHSMSCYEKHHGHDDGGYHHGDGYEGYEEGYGHGPKELICCKDKKHKEKKHKHKKHKKHHHKHMKFHVVIKGKIPEHSCHGGGDEEGEHYDGGYDEHEGYRSAVPQGHQKNVEHKPMDVSVWTNRQKTAKKHPFRRPIHQHQQHPRPPSPYAGPPAYPAPYPESRGKSAEPPMPEVMPESHDTHPLPPPPPSPPEETPQVPAPPSLPVEPKSSPVTPLPERPLTPPPNLYDGAPVGPKKSPQQEPPKPHSFPPPPPPPSMITVDPPPKRKESSRAYSEPSCEFDSYDFNFYHPAPAYHKPPPTYHPPPPPTYHPPPPPTYHPPPPPTYHPPSPPTYHPPPPPPTYHAPPPSYHKPAPAYHHPPAPSYRSSSSSQYKPPPPPPAHVSDFSSSYPEPPYHASHYHPHHDQYESPKHYSAYEKPLDYSSYDDSYDGNDYEGDNDAHQHGVHAFSDHDDDDWPEYPPRHPADILTYNQIVSRQIIEADTVQRYTDRPFQPTPRPLRDEFEPPTAEVGPVLFDFFGPPDKNYEMYDVPTPPPDAFIPPEPPAPAPVQFPEPENGPVTFSPNSEEALYPQPTPPPHYLLMKDAGGFSSFGFEHDSPSGFGRYDHERQHRSLIVEPNPLILSVGEWHLLLRVPNERRVVHPKEGTDFVVAQETGLVGELPGQAAARSRRPNVELRLVDERERTAVRWHADQQLLLRCTLLYPLARTVVNGQLLLVVGGRIKREQWRVVSDLTFPLAVEIVRHDVDEVEIFGDLRHIVTGGDRFERGGNGGRQQETWLSGRFRFTLERNAQLTQQIDVRLTIVGTSWILPIDVEPIELILAQELDRFVHELVHAEHVRRELLERGGTERPATDGEQDLQVGVLFAQRDHLIVHIRIVFVRLRQLVVLERGKGVDDVRAEGGIDVLRFELAGTRALHRPARQVQPNTDPTFSTIVAATEDQSTSFASLPRLTPRSSSRIAPISGYFTFPPHTVPEKSSISTVHTIAPPNPFVLIQLILLRIARSSSNPTH
uniref:Uncharacterized protein n=1 Tax=Anopheles farauti TaxID=69004 RepID=A0A182Q6U0_9DIPT